MDRLDTFLTRAEIFIDRLEALLPPPAVPTDWEGAVAFRWRKKNQHGFLQPVPRPHLIRLNDLCDIQDQKQRIQQNTYQFVKGQYANNVLLTGARGTGKSSLIKALLNEYASQGLRLIEVDKDDLVDLPDIIELLAIRPERFIIFCDDLSFEEAEPGYKAMKSVLDGSISAVSDNVLIYATSNRRHLMPEYHSDNLQMTRKDGELHPGEAVEEKVSLSERFGMWISFYPFSQEDYLAIVAHWLNSFGIREMTEECRQEALQWALGRGSRSGRVGWQFARDYAGRMNSGQVAG